MIKYKVRWATDSDYDKIIEFISGVFELDFREILPKYYGNNPDNALKHVIAEDEKGILACVGVFPTILSVGEIKLNGSIIGSVSVHQRARGLGLMRELMNEAMNKVEKLRSDFAVLSGDRQRYEYFGFTAAGILYEFYFNQNNKRHLGVNENITFKPTREKDYADKINELHEKQLIKYLRPKSDVANICKSYNNEIYTVFDGEAVGYLIAKGNEINELNVEKDRYTDVVIAFMNYKKLESVKCFVPPTKTGTVKELSLTSEKYAICNCCNLRVDNYPKMIEAFLKAKKSISPLESGKAVIQIVGKGKYLISVKSNEITVKESAKKADLVFTEFEAIQKMFTGAGFLQEDEFTKNWFPLPYFIEVADNG